jgi:hypothetical protein
LWGSDGFGGADVFVSGVCAKEALLETQHSSVIQPDTFHRRGRRGTRRNANAALPQIKIRWTQIRKSRRRFCFPEICLSRIYLCSSAFHLWQK